MQTLREVLTRLQDNGFAVNPLKCEWAVQETDWLGYWLTPTGLKPWSKKIQAIIKISPPQNIKQLRSFIGAVNYYRDMWPRRAHILAPLTALTGCSKFIWEDTHQRAFLQMKALIAQDTMLAYPDHNRPFHIFTDASDYQLGAVIIQNGKPVAYFSRKLSPAQRNYSTIEKEMLSIVETLREFRTTLLGAELHIHTDHRNLTFDGITTERVIRWRLFVENFAPSFHWVRGSLNPLADCLSRLPFSEGQDAPGPDSPGHKDVDTKDTDLFFSLVQDDTEQFECLLNVPLEPEPIINPVNYIHLHEVQQQQPALWNLPQVHPDRYSYQQFGNVNLVCYRIPLEHNWKIFVPDALLHRLVRWYHSVLCHAGINNLHQTLSMVYHHPQLHATVEKWCRECPTCQRYKLMGPGYGYLAPREARTQPWYEVAVDTIGPWEIVIDGETHKFYALTIIDTVTNLVELTRVSSTRASEAATQLEITWLMRYPRPVRMIHDQGTEFTGEAFQRVLRIYGIRNAPIGTRNPQANAICERMHQVVGNVLRTLLHTNPPQNMNDAEALVDYALATASHALRSTVHRTMGVSPGSLVFHRDMFIDIPYVADLLLLRDKRQALIDYNLRRENNRRRNYDYQVGDQVLEILPAPTKLGHRTTGPFPILQIHTNGTVTIQRSPGLRDRLNIRRLRPFICP
jgi:transposase InsO family protein